MIDDKRMAGDYEILHAIHIGDRELVVGEDLKAEPDSKYLCAYYVDNEIIGSYEDCMVGGDYLETMELFTKRLNEQISLVRTEQNRIAVPLETITDEHCFPNDRSKDINGKIVAVKAEFLRGEYRTADRQLVLVTGGFGASANSRGSKVFCTNLYHGKKTHWNRNHIQGEVKPEHIPDWAKQRLSALQEKQPEKKMDKER